MGRTIHPREMVQISRDEQTACPEASGLLHPPARRNRPRPSAIGSPRSRSGTPRRCGFDSAWIAQHHFHEGEGGLPAPFVFLAHVAAQTSRIRLGTGIVTLPLELPIRVAEDAVVTDLMSGGRLEVGVGPGGNLTAFTAFGLDSNDRHVLIDRQPRHAQDGLGRRHAAGRRQALSVEPGPGRPHLAGDLHRGGRAPRRRGRRRADAVAHPAALAGRAESVARRHPEPDARRLSRGAAQGPRAAHPRLAHGVRRRRSQGGDAPRRDRPVAHAPPAGGHGQSLARATSWATSSPPWTCISARPTR